VSCSSRVLLLTLCFICRFGRELVSVSFAAIIAPFIAVLSFAPIEFVHLYLHVPYYCACVVALFSVTCVFWSFDRCAPAEAEDTDYVHNTRVCELLHCNFLYLIYYPVDIWPMVELLGSFLVYGIVLLSLASLADPEWNVPTSVWQPIGPCEKMEPIHTLVGGAIPLVCVYLNMLFVYLFLLDNDTQHILVSHTLQGVVL
jgi:hypothetical protein